MIGDTDSCDQLLQDGEIEYILDDYNQVPLNAAIRSCEGVIAKFSRLADESVGQVKITLSQKAKSYRSLILDLQSRLSYTDAAPFAGGISVTQVQTTNANADRIRPDFTSHMMENHQLSPWITGGPWGGWAWWGGE